MLFNVSHSYCILRVSDGQLTSDSSGGTCTRTHSNAHQAGIDKMMVEHMDGSKNASWMKHAGIQGTGNHRKKSKGNPGASKPHVDELTTSIIGGRHRFLQIGFHKVVSGVEILWISIRMQWCCFGTVRFRSSKALWMSSSFQEWGWSKSKLGANAILAVAWHQHGTMRLLWRTRAENPKLIGDHSRFYQDLVHFAFLRNITLTSVAEHAMIMPVSYSVNL